MLDQFLAFIEKHELFKRDDNLLVAVSGGKDSVLLADLLHKTSFSFSIAHCNFNLRGHESDEDEKFVKSIAKTYGCPFYLKQFETNKYAEEKGLSIQMAARQLRYDWFHELVSNNSVDFLLTAHHLNDSIETALFNFVKGTGVSGLKGINYETGIIRRPLLFAKREEIDSYAEETGLEWREDSSNESKKYHRNKIRHEILPKLKEINPSLEETFRNTAKRMISTDNLIDHAVENLRCDVITEGRNETVLLKRLANEELVVIERFLKPYKFNFTQAEELQELIRAKSTGKVLRSESTVITIDREKLYLALNEKEESVKVKISKGINQITFNSYQLDLSTTNDLSINNRPEEAKLDLAKLEFPLILRKWQQGDRFQPLGMIGKKKLSDFMIDEKIPLNLKSEVLVLVSENKVVWVVGKRIDDRFKITSETTKALHLKLSHD